MLFCYITNMLLCRQDGNPSKHPRSSSQPVECSKSKPKTESFKSGISRVKSFLPVPRNKVSLSSQSTKQSSSSSSNTRQIEAVSDSKEEIWNMHKKMQLEKYE